MALKPKRHRRGFTGYTWPCHYKCGASFPTMDKAKAHERKACPVAKAKGLYPEKKKRKTRKDKGK